MDEETSATVKKSKKKSLSVKARDRKRRREFRRRKAKTSQFLPFCEVLMLLNLV